MDKYLIVDDNLDRHEIYDDYLCKLFPGCEQIHNLTYNSTISTLEHNQDFKMIFLDHDLMDFTGPSEKPERTGHDIAKWMAENYADKEVIIIIHSWNGWGANNMARTLIDAGFKNVLQQPFNPLDLRSI